MTRAQMQHCGHIHINTWQLSRGTTHSVTSPNFVIVPQYRAVWLQFTREYHATLQILTSCRTSDCEAHARNSNDALIIDPRALESGLLLRRGHSSYPRAIL